MWCSSKVLQMILAAYNLSMIIVALIFIAIAASFFKNGPLEVGFLLVAQGCFLLIISFFGFAGSFFKLRCSLIIYITILILLMVIKLVVGGGMLAVALNNDTIDKLSQTFWDNSTISWQEIFQKTHKCCGYLNTEDEGVFQNHCDYTEGCRAVLMKSSAEIFKKIAAFTFLSSSLELIGIIVSFKVLNEFNMNKSGYERIPESNKPIF
jgi:hypothetical protein